MKIFVLSVALFVASVSADILPGDPRFGSGNNYNYAHPERHENIQLPSTSYGVPFKTEAQPAPAPAPVPHRQYGPPLAEAPLPAPIMPHKTYGPPPAAPVTRFETAPAPQVPVPAPIMPHNTYGPPSAPQMPAFMPFKTYGPPAAPSVPANRYEQAPANRPNTNYLPPVKQMPVARPMFQPQPVQRPAPSPINNYLPPTQAPMRLPVSAPVPTNNYLPPNQPAPQPMPLPQRMPAPINNYLPPIRQPAPAVPAPSYQPVQPAPTFQPAPTPVNNYLPPNQPAPLPVQNESAPQQINVFDGSVEFEPAQPSVPVSEQHLTEYEYPSAAQPVESAPAHDYVQQQTDSNGGYIY